LKEALESLLDLSAKTTAAVTVESTTGSTNGPSLASRLPLKVLVADDNLINQKVASRLLQQLGYTADIASTGAEAISMLEKGDYDLVFMDVQMPGMDGLETTRHIRDFERRTSRRPAKIIAMTANAMMGDRDKCLRAGMDDYLAKPVRPDALQAAIERVVTRPHGSVAVDQVPPALPTPAPASTPEPPGAALVDLERLTEFAGGSRTSLIEITDLYFAQTSEQLDRFEQAVKQSDAETVARVAHSSAGASGVCGVIAMEPLLRQAEQFANENQVAKAATLLPDLRRNFQRVKDFLLNFRQNMPLS
jgi:CheY-like chemotaxis protein/HPt (histidine-containing phosphotransfer) domain-containing protein